MERSGMFDNITRTPVGESSVPFLMEDPSLVSNNNNMSDDEIYQYQPSTQDSQGSFVTKEVNGVKVSYF